MSLDYHPSRYAPKEVGNFGGKNARCSTVSHHWYLGLNYSVGLDLKKTVYGSDQLLSVSSVPILFSSLLVNLNSLGHPSLLILFLSIEKGLLSVFAHYSNTSIRMDTRIFLIGWKC